MGKVTRIDKSNLSLNLCLSLGSCPDADVDLDLGDLLLESNSTLKEVTNPTIRKFHYAVAEY